MLAADSSTGITGALSATSLAYVEIDRSGLIREWNPAAERLFGWSRAEVLGRALADTLVPAHLRAAHAAGFARRLVAGDDAWAGTQVQVPACHRDGAELLVTMVINGLEDGYCAFLSDRTEWHRSQQELQRSTTLISSILEHTSAMISATDLDGRFLFVNHEYERVFQVSAPDLVGRLGSETLPEPVAAAWRRSNAQVAATGEAVTALEEVPFGDDVRQYVVTRFPLADPDGSVYGVCAIAIDDTERRHSEAALGASERRFRATVNNAPGMLFQFRIAADGATSFTFVSEACREIYGLEPRAVMADPELITEIVAEEDRAAFSASVSEAVLTLQPWRWQGSVIRPDGERRWLHGVARPHRLADGSTVCDGMLVDRTCEHRTEVELDELTRRLAVHRFTVVPGDGGRLLVTESTGEDPLTYGGMDAAWADARAGRPADVELPERGLWVRLRPRRAEGRLVIDGFCFPLVTR
ncbi:PAS domain S-box protein [Actinoplanes sp. NPDC049596]|uniref:PAS domain-containing protein n=1 Tax=unclassified Actinoplanes TaxID=2626549 RepID=UPI003421FBA6